MSAGSLPLWNHSALLFTLELGVKADPRGPMVPRILCYPTFTACTMESERGGTGRRQGEEVGKRVQQGIFLLTLLTDHHGIVVPLYWKPSLCQAALSIQLSSESVVMIPEGDNGSLLLLARIPYNFLLVSLSSVSLHTLRVKVLFVSCSVLEWYNVTYFWNLTQQKEFSWHPTDTWLYYLIFLIFVS